MTGKYSGKGHKDFLPFTVRFYIAAGATSLRIVHFFIYDGDQFKDFIKGIVRYMNPSYLNTPEPSQFTGVDLHHTSIRRAI